MQLPLRNVNEPIWSDNLKVVKRRAQGKETNPKTPRVRTKRMLYTIKGRGQGDYEIIERQCSQ